jgi:hypothetical protein
MRYGYWLRVFGSWLRKCRRLGNGSELEATEGVHSLKRVKREIR